MHHRKGWQVVNPLIVALTLIFTVGTALSLGVFAGYAAVTAILHLMRREPAPAAERALATSQASSGD